MSDIYIQSPLRASLCLTPPVALLDVPVGHARCVIILWTSRQHLCCFPKTSERNTQRVRIVLLQKAFLQKVLGQYIALCLAQHTRPHHMAGEWSQTFVYVTARSRHLVAVWRLSTIPTLNLTCRRMMELCSQSGRRKGSTPPSASAVQDCRRGIDRFGRGELAVVFCVKIMTLLNRLGNT